MSQATPMWKRLAAMLLGVAGVLLGAFLTIRPFASLSVLVLVIAVSLVISGLSDLAARRNGADRHWFWLSAIIAFALAVIVLLWPGLTIDVLAILVAAWLIVTGVLRIAQAIRGDIDGRVASAVIGLAGTILGILALLWPDVTILVVAVLFGIWLIVGGVILILDAIRGERAVEVGGRRRPGLVRRFVRTAAALTSLGLAILLAIVAVAFDRGVPRPDDFYSWTADSPETAGELLRSEPFSRAIPDGARAWRILYSTTNGRGDPTLASGLVVAPAGPGAAPAPVIAWAHGTTGVAEGCAPSLLDDPLYAGAAPAVDEVIANGWVIVASDYIGLGTAGPHEYLVGPPAGRAVLDAVRAARALTDLELAGETVVWGHSQGGHAALWTGVEQSAYAPDVPLAGVAALAPASDLPALVDGLDDVTGGTIFASYVLRGYAAAYDDVRIGDLVRPQAELLVEEMASRCLSEPSVLASVLESLVVGNSIFIGDPKAGASGERLRENVPSGPIEAPVLIGQGLADELVVPEAQDAYVAARCAAGNEVDYRTFEGFDHVGIVLDEGSPLIPELLAWTQDRIDGSPPTPNCASTQTAGGSVSQGEEDAAVDQRSG